MSAGRGLRVKALLVAILASGSAGIGERSMIAGEAPNTPENLIRWIENPQSIEPNTAMPNLGVGDQAARDMAAYLYTLR
jgi:cytochrome c